MQALAISTNRRYLAVSECVEKASITVFDLQHEQSRKRKVLTAGEIPVNQFVCMAFSPDSKYLIGQAGGPDWTLFLWMWEKKKVMATVKTSTDGPINQVNTFNMKVTVNGQISPQNQKTKTRNYIFHKEDKVCFRTMQRFVTVALFS